MTVDLENYDSCVTFAGGGASFFGARMEAKPSMTAGVTAAMLGLGLDQNQVACIEKVLRIEAGKIHEFSDELRMIGGA